MKTLFLLRHAKSSWDDLSLSDIDRPLNRRGERAAGLMGRWLRQQSVQPDLVLCSPARRAIETWQAIAAAFEQPPKDVVRSEIYGADVNALHSIVQELPPTIGTVLAIGHNPTFEQYATWLAAEAQTEIFRRMALKFPTCAIARFTSSVQNWRDFGSDTADLEMFVTPKELRQRPN